MTGLRIGFVPCLPPGPHPGMDALLSGLRLGVEADGATLDVEPADLRRDDATSSQDHAVQALIDRGAAAVVLFSLNLREPARAVAAANERGVPVVAIHHSALRVAASLIVPNFAHGVSLAGALADALCEASVPRRVGFIGPPDILDDVEFAQGVAMGLAQTGLECVNDPTDPRYRNLADVAGQGRASVERLLDDHHAVEPIVGLVVFNDETAHDAMPALRERGLLGRLPVVCRNGSPAIAAAVARGEVHATFDYQLPELGMHAARLVARVLAGEAEPGELVAAPVGRLVTRSTLDRYRPWADRLNDLAPLAAGGTA